MLRDAICFKDAPTSDIYTLSLHDALPICVTNVLRQVGLRDADMDKYPHEFSGGQRRSEEHTSELQSHSDIVCRLLLEKKNSWLRRNDWLHCGSQQDPRQSSVTGSLMRGSA